MAASISQDTVTLRSSVVTDVGLVRTHNEDCSMIDEQMRFFIVADGMGGHAAGEVASAMAVEGVSKVLNATAAVLQTYAEQFDEDAQQQVANILEQAVRDAHRSVFDCGKSDPSKQGMGTTLDVLLVSGQEAFVAHVGDSRTYLMRDGVAAQITTDHTVAEVLVIKGKLSAEEALSSPLRTILVNALGVSEEIGVEMAHLTLHQGDKLLICSDGLHDYFPETAELYNEVTSKTPDAALSHLVNTANERGGHDNITAIIVEVLNAPAVEISEDTRPHSISVPPPCASDTSDENSTDNGTDEKRQKTLIGIGPASNESPSSSLKLQKKVTTTGDQTARVRLRGDTRDTLDMPISLEIDDDR